MITILQNSIALLNSSCQFNKVVAFHNARNSSIKEQKKFKTISNHRSINDRLYNTEKFPYSCKLVQ